MNEKITEIDALIVKLNAVTEERNVLQREIRAKKLEYIKEKYNIDVGDIVCGHDGKEYKIASMQLPNSLKTKMPIFGKPFITGYSRKKDGGWSKRCAVIYGDWEHKS